MTHPPAIHVRITQQMLDEPFSVDATGSTLKTLREYLSWYFTDDQAAQVGFDKLDVDGEVKRVHGWDFEDLMFVALDVFVASANDGEVVVHALGQEFQLSQIVSEIRDRTPKGAYFADSVRIDHLTIENAVCRGDFEIEPAVRLPKVSAPPRPEFDF